MHSNTTRGFTLGAALLLLLAGGVAPANEETIPLEIDREASRIAAHVQATGHSFDAVIVDYDLELTWNPETKTVASARFSFDFAAVETGRDRRDREMRDWLDYDTHPDAEFVLERIEERGGEHRAHGTFRLHGREREISFPAEIFSGRNALRIRSRTTLDHRDWELEPIRAFLFMTVDPELEIQIDLRANLP